MKSPLVVYFRSLFDPGSEMYIAEDENAQSFGCDPGGSTAVFSNFACLSNRRNLSSVLVEITAKSPLFWFTQIPWACGTDSSILGPVMFE